MNSLPEELLSRQEMITLTIPKVLRSLRTSQVPTEVMSSLECLASLTNLRPISKPLSTNSETTSSELLTTPLGTSKRLRRRCTISRLKRNREKLMLSSLTTILFLLRPLREEPLRPVRTLGRLSLTPRLSLKLIENSS